MRPYQVGQKYLYRAIARLVYEVSAWHYFVQTDPINGVVYRAIFTDAGESMNGKVVMCTYCEIVENVS